jgi:PTH1 family peptidyl-tRNA hydrolase
MAGFLKKLFGRAKPGTPVGTQGEKLQNNDTEVKYLIVGLGNIGAEYAETRHNIGFKVLDALAASDAVFMPSRYGAGARITHKGRTLVLLEPSTYMNLSGKAVAYWMQQEKVPLENLLVVTDDLALPYGTLRIRAKGSDGGHNGLKSINASLGTTDYARMRMGIGSDFPQGMQVDYVLSEWSREEKAAMPAILVAAGDAIRSFAAIGLERTMNLYNKRPATENPKK